jgi:hypothetical protein
VRRVVGGGGEACLGGCAWPRKRFCKLLQGQKEARVREMMPEAHALHRMVRSH